MNYTYRELQQLVNRIANVLVGKLGLVTGGRVLLRSANNPMMVATYLAVLKAGGIVVATMPLLRAKELAYPIQKAKIALALCDGKLADEMEKAKAAAPELKRMVYWGSGQPGLAGGADRGREPGLHRGRHRLRRCLPDRLHLRHHGRAEGHHAFPSRHARGLRRLRAATCCAPGRDDRFIGSPPLAFTFGFGGCAVPAAHRRLLRAAGEAPGPTTCSPAIAHYKRHRLLHRADRLPRHARQARRRTTSPACANASPPARRCRRAPSTPGSRRPASS